MVSDLGYKTTDYSRRVSHVACDTGTTVKENKPLFSDFEILT